MRKIRSNRAFTLIEIIAVLVILGIVAVVAISRVTATETAQIRASVDTLKGHLRYAQSLAMNDLPGIQWGINISGPSYSLVKYDLNVLQTPTPVNLPNESSDTHTFPATITASTGVNPILFDHWGSPGNAGVTVTINGQSFTISAETGFIP